MGFLIGLLAGGLLVALAIYFFVLKPTHTPSEDDYYVLQYDGTPVTYDGEYIIWRKD